VGENCENAVTTKEIPKWRVLASENQANLGFKIISLVTNFFGLLTGDCSVSLIIFFMQTTKLETITAVVDAIKRFRQDYEQNYP